LILEEPLRLKTVPKLGYRFEGKIDRIEAEQSSRKGRNLIPGVIGLVLLTAAAAFLFYMFGPQLSPTPLRLSFRPWHYQRFSANPMALATRFIVSFERVVTRDPILPLAIVWM